MTADKLLKLAASAPIALASSGAAYVAATSESESNANEIEILEAQLEQLKEQNKGYIYMLQKAEYDIAVLKASMYATDK